MFHLGAAMNTGLSEAKMRDFISVLKSRVDNKVAESANELLSKVLNRKSQ
jgi:4-carboxymuconolactone decarboxylase